MQQRIVHPIGPSELEDYGLLLQTYRTLEAITEGDAVYLNASGYLGRARANSSTTMHAIGVAHRAIASGIQGRVVTHGPFRTSGYNFSGFIGRNAYVSPDTVGAISTTPPTSSGQIVQHIGFLSDGSLLYVSIGTSFQRGGATP